MIEGRRIVQFVSFISSVMATVTLVFVFIRALDRRRRAYLIAPIMYFAHVIIYYVVVFLGAMDIIAISIIPTWSSALNLHAIITIVTLAYIVIKQSKWLTG